MEYIVKALSVGGLGSKIHNAGETVTDENFVAGRAQELVEAGFLEAVKGAESDSIDSKEPKGKKAVKGAESDSSDSKE